MKFRFLLLISLVVFSFTATNAQCFEIESILVDACGNPEGANEMVRIKIGPADLNIANISVSWATAGYVWQGACQNANTSSRVAAINASILSCGYVLEPTGGVLPAGATVVIVTSDTMDVAANSFAFLSDTIYLVFQCAWTTQGHFANYNATPGIRTLSIGFSSPAGCSDVVSYDRTQLVNIFGTTGGSSADRDGASVSFTAGGTPTYYNDGCQAPINSISNGWIFTDEICNDYGVVNLTPLLSSGTDTGGVWTGPRVTGSYYNPAGYTGLDSIKYTLITTGACADTLDSTIVFNVVAPSSSMITIQSCDSVFLNGTWYTTSTTVADTLFGSGYACDSIATYTITINNAITDSSYLSACNSLTFNGTTYTADIILRDTIFGGSGGPIVIDTILQTGFEDAEGWIDHSSGNWTQVDANGTWNAVGMYANQFNPNNGIRNVGLNDVGDYLEFPPVSNPQTLYYWDRLSGAATSTNELTIEYFDGTNWIAIASDICTSEVYELVTIDLSSISGLTNVAIRIYRSADQRSAYIDDIVIVGSTSSTGSSCDSVFITNIDILDPVVGNNPNNPIIICNANDSTQLADGTFVSAAGSYPILYPNGSASGCDSTYVTVVQTQSCDFTCNFETILYDGFEYDSVIPGLVPGTVIHNSPRGTSSPFIGMARTGTRFAYFNMQGTPGNVVYTRQVEMCPNTDFRYSFWSRQFGNNAGSNITINMYDGADNTAPLLNTYTFTNNGTTYQQYQSVVMTATNDTVFFELIDNIGGPVVGNDLHIDYFIFEACLIDTLVLPNQNLCANNAPIDLYNEVTPSAGTGGSWAGPSALTNGHLGTFNPATNAYGTYYYTVPGPTNCGDTTLSITVTSLNSQVGLNATAGCDSVLFNGVWYFASTTVNDTIIGGASSGCDSVYQTSINVLNSVTVYNPNNPLVICNVNDSVQLPDGTYAYAAGSYPITYVSNASCDSIYITEVVTTVCNCQFDLGPDTAFCQGESLVLDPGPGFDSYTWQDNSNNQTFTATSTGTYYVTATYIDSTNNLVNNGDFEQGNTGFTTDYTVGTGGPWGQLSNAGTYAINTSPSNVHNNFFTCPDHTSGTGNMMIVNGSNTPNTNVWCQTITVTPNTDYIFSAWAMSLENTNFSNVATLHFLINGVQFGPNFSPSFTACDWQQFSTTWTSGSNTSIQICIESDVISGNNDYALDDIFFTPYCNNTDSINVTVNPFPVVDLGPDVSICQGNDTLLDATTAGASYLWQDGVSSTATFSAQNAGLYWVDVTLNNCTSRDSLNLRLNPVYNQTLNVSICEGDSAFLANAWQTTPGVYTDNFNSINACDSIVVTTLSVLTSQTVNSTIEVCADALPVDIFGNLESTPGMYIDTITNALGCDSLISNVELIVNPLPSVSLGNDTSIDAGNTVVLSVVNPSSSDSYSWTNSLGETFAGESITTSPSETASYILSATNQFNSSSIDSILVVVNPLEAVLLQIPTAFSPNGDGINDVFRIANFEDFESYTLRVYNRWGELIFDNQGYNISWDGTYQGVKQNIGAYAFYIEAKPISGAEVMKVSGNITLIR